MIGFIRYNQFSQLKEIAKIASIAKIAEIENFLLQIYADDRRLKEIFTTGTEIGGRKNTTKTMC
jgi:hypothetical protein